MSTRRNPILEGASHPSEDWREWLIALHDPREVFSYESGEENVLCTPEQISHARKVLGRLARLHSEGFNSDTFYGPGWRG